MATEKAGDKASRIALILYTVRDFAADAAQAAKTLARLGRIGYRNVQVSGKSFMELDPVELRKMADDAGLSIVGAHIGVDMMRQDLGRVADQLCAWGAAYVAIPSWRPEGEDKAAGWRAFAKECNSIGRGLKKRGIQLQYHNHAFEFEKFGIRGGRGGKTAHAILFGGSDPAMLQAELDLGWVARAGVDPAEYLKGFKGRSDQVHVKDWGIVNNEPAWREVGEGNLNWPAIIRQCKAVGVRMYIVEQDACPVTNDPFRSARISFDYLMTQAL